MSQLPQEASVTSNVAPKHFGVAIGFEYEAARDGNEKQWQLPYEDTWRVSVMKWHINKVGGGSTILTRLKVTCSFLAIG